MERTLADLFVSFGALFFGIGLVSYFVLMFWSPYMAWSATRNFQQIRQQLERLNDRSNRKWTITRSGLWACDAPLKPIRCVALPCSRVCTPRYLASLLQPSAR